MSGGGLVAADCTNVPVEHEVHIWYRGVAGLGVGPIPLTTCICSGQGRLNVAPEPPASRSDGRTGRDGTSMQGERAGDGG